MAANPFPIADLAVHADWLRRLGHAVAGAAGGDDLAQETFIAAWAHAPDRSLPLRPWPGRVLANFGRMRLRAERQRDERQRRWSESVSASPPTPEELLESHEILRRLAAAVSTLGEPHRSTVILRYAEGRTSAEVARLQGVPAATVRGRLRDALDKLRAHMDTDHDGGCPRWVVALADVPHRPTAKRNGTLPHAVLLTAATTAVVGLVVMGAHHWAGSTVRRPPLVSPRESTMAAGPSGGAVPAHGGGSGTIQGTVLSPHGTPVVGAQVIVTPLGTNRYPLRMGRGLVGATDTTGHFVVSDVPVGNYAVSAMAEGLGPVHVPPVTIAAATTTTVELRMEADGFLLSGRCWTPAAVRSPGRSSLPGPKDPSSSRPPQTWKGPTTCLSAPASTALKLRPTVI